MSLKRYEILVFCLNSMEYYAPSKNPSIEMRDPIRTSELNSKLMDLLKNHFGMLIKEEDFIQKNEVEVTIYAKHIIVSLKNCDILLQNYTKVSEFETLPKKTSSKIHKLKFAAGTALVIPTVVLLKWISNQRKFSTQLENLIKNYQTVNINHNFHIFKETLSHKELRLTVDTLREHMSLGMKVAIVQQTKIMVWFILELPLNIDLFSEFLKVFLSYVHVDYIVLFSTKDFDYNIPYKNLKWKNFKSLQSVEMFNSNFVTRQWLCLTKKCIEPSLLNVDFMMFRMSDADTPTSKYSLF